jgi:DNA polymerase-3 subunit alpha
MDELALPGEDLNTTRARLAAQLPAALQGAEQAAHNAAAGITDLFGGIAPDTEEAGASVELACLQREEVVPLTTRERLQGEKEALGLYLTGHPIEEYMAELKHFCRRRIGELRAEKKSQWVSGMVVSTRIMKSRRGAPMCFLVLDDRSARLEVSLFPECFDKFGRKVTKDELLIIEGEVQQDDFSGGLTLRAEKVFTISEARQRFSSGVLIDFTATQLPDDFSPRLKSLLSPHRNEDQGCSVAVLYTAAEAQARIALGDAWRVHASDDLLRSLRDAFGNVVQLQYTQN